MDGRRGGGVHKWRAFTEWYVHCFEILSVTRELNGMMMKGKWEVLDRPEKLEESVARRLNCALDDIAQENKDDELNNEGKESGSEYKVRRQNATLEDFTSFAKRGRKNDLLCSPPSKSKRGASINITEDRKVAR